MASIAWVTKGDYAGRPILMSDADKTRAIANNWALAAALEWKASDSAAIAVRDAVVDTGDLGNWQEKVSDPKYTAAADDAGTYTPPTGGAITNIVVATPTVDDAAAANTVVGAITVTGGLTPVTLSLPGGTTLWNISGTNLRKTSATAGLYTVGTMVVNIKATGSDGESFTKAINITVT